MNHLLVYVVTRDFGFAPNPFHGCCTLATCKPKLRNSAKVGDWILGVGGQRLKAEGRCIYLMKISEILIFDEYWNEPRFQIKKPHRNGSDVTMVGDNIYHRDIDTHEWVQEDSHHSNPDSTQNAKNLETDTSSEKVLISDFFVYFGSCAQKIDLSIIGYRNLRGFSKYSLNSPNVQLFLKIFMKEHSRNINLVLCDPIDFKNASKRVDQHSGKIF